MHRFVSVRATSPLVGEVDASALCAEASGDGGSIHGRRYHPILRRDEGSTSPIEGEVSARPPLLILSATRKMCASRSASRGRDICARSHAHLQSSPETCESHSALLSPAPSSSPPTAPAFCSPQRWARRAPFRLGARRRPTHGNFVALVCRPSCFGCPRRNRRQRAGTARLARRDHGVARGAGLRSLDGGARLAQHPPDAAADPAIVRAFPRLHRLADRAWPPSALDSRRALAASVPRERVDAAVTRAAPGAAQARALLAPAPELPARELGAARRRPAPAHRLDRARLRRALHRADPDGDLDLPHRASRLVERDGVVMLLAAFFGAIGLAVNFGFILGARQRHHLAFLAARRGSSRAGPPSPGSVEVTTNVMSIGLGERSAARINRFSA